MNQNMQRESVIYALTDEAGNFGYIGSTKVNAQTRWWEHRSRARRGHTAPVYEWMRNVGVENVQIHVVADIPSDMDAAELETKFIKKFLDEGHPLQNQIGRDGKPHSNADRMKQILSEKKRGKPTWIKGKRGIEAGWTEERRKQQSERSRARYANK